MSDEIRREPETPIEDAPRGERARELLDEPFDARLDGSPEEPAGEEPGPTFGEPEEPRRRSALPPVLIFLLVVLLFGGGLFLYLRYFREAPEAPPPPERAEAPPPSAPEAPPPAELEGLPPAPRSLEESDGYLRQVADRLSAHPQLARYLVPERLVVRLTAAVDNVARGESPRNHLRFLDPGRGFEADVEGPRVTVAPRSYARYDLATEVFASLDPQAVAAIYRQLRPLFDQAYGELGYPGTTFDATLAAAIGELLATPVPSGEVELVPRVSNYAYRDPTLEGLSPAQKHLLRLGPDNARRVQAKLRQLAAALGLEVRGGT